LLGEGEDSGGIRGSRGRTSIRVKFLVHPKVGRAASIESFYMFSRPTLNGRRGMELNSSKRKARDDAAQWVCTLWYKRPRWILLTGGI